MLDDHSGTFERVGLKMSMENTIVWNVHVLPTPVNIGDSTLKVKVYT